MVEYLYCTTCSGAKLIFSYRVRCRKKVNILGVSDVGKIRMLLFELEIICIAVGYLNHFLKCAIRNHLDSGSTDTYHHGASAAMGVAASPSKSSDLFIYLFIHCTSSDRSTQEGLFYDHRQYRIKRQKLIFRT